MLSSKIFSNESDYYSGISKPNSESFGINYYLSEDQNIIQLFINQKLYEFTGYTLATKSESSNYVTIITGSFSPNENYNLATIKFENKNSNSSLYLLIEDLSDGSLKEITLNITNQEYNSIYQSAINNGEHFLEKINSTNTNEAQFELKKQILKCLQPNKNFKYSRNISKAQTQKNTQTFTAQSSQSFKSTNSYTAQSASYTILKSFFDNLIKTGKATTDASLNRVLTQTGWKLYKTSDYFYIMDGSKNNSHEYYSCVSVIKITKEHDKSLRRLTTKMKVLYSVCLSYNSTTKKAEVLYYEAGVRMNCPVIAIELVNGDTTFSHYTKTYSLEGKKSLLNLLTAVSSKLGKASKIWDALSVSSYTSDSDSLDASDKVRAIANKANTNTYLWTSNKSIGIYGTYRKKTFSSYRIAYSFTAYSII